MRRRTELLPQKLPWRSRSARCASCRVANRTTAFSAFSLSRLLLPSGRRLAPTWVGTERGRMGAV